MDKMKIHITDNNQPLGPQGNINGQCCGKGFCHAEETAAEELCAMNCTCACTASARSLCPVLMTVLVLLLSSALAFTGWSIGHGITHFNTAQRVVSVRGFAERPVKADLALWNIGYVATGNDLNVVQTKIENDSRSIRAFLKTAGLPDDAIIELPTSMTDLLSRDYRAQGAEQARYIVNAGFRVRTDQVDLVSGLSGLKIGDLIKAGVTLRDNQPPEYIFTQLKTIKPEMVAEATDDARRAATQFAKDSGAHLKGMKAAQQGVFQFLARDQASGVMENQEINKTVRVVTTADYYLAD